MKKETIVVWFSCGAASAVAAKKTIELFGSTHDIKVVNTYVYEEHEDNRRFMRDVEKWIGQEILQARNSKAGTDSCVVIWNERKYMSGTKGAPCTMILKKGARYEYERKIRIDWHVLGFTSDEKKRHDDFVHSERENVVPVLIDLGINKADCFEILRTAGIELPLIYRLGFTNANCIGCVKATSPTYWNLVRKEFPEVFEARAIQSREIGARLVRVKGERKFLDELKTTDRGAKMKSWDCGIFCDTD